MSDLSVRLERYQWRCKLWGLHRGQEVCENCGGVIRRPNLNGEEDE